MQIFTSLPAEKFKQCEILYFKILFFFLSLREKRYIILFKKKDFLILKKDVIFTESSKSMEPDMIVEMVERTLEKGVRMEGLVGDDDTTAITRINKE